MRTIEGVVDIEPVIKRVLFDKPGKMTVKLEDGREVIVPLGLFPSIKKIPTHLRSKHQIANGTIIIFKHCDEVFHIEQILGRYSDYQYKG